LKNFKETKVVKEEKPKLRVCTEYKLNVENCQKLDLFLQSKGISDPYKDCTLKKPIL